MKQITVRIDDDTAHKLARGAKTLTSAATQALLFWPEVVEQSLGEVTAKFSDDEIKAFVESIKRWDPMTDKSLTYAQRIALVVLARREP